MNNINKDIEFVPINISVLTISDTRNEEDDKSGKLLLKKINESKHNLIDKKIIKDDLLQIKKTIIEWSNKKNIDVIITTGGTGLTGRDSTPEALLEISDKIIDGFGELFRQISFTKIGTSSIQSRALGCVVNGKYVFSLPGSPSACKDAWEEILKFQLDIRHKPCNFVEILPRLKEK